jgi:hypothetical protein
MRSLAAFIMRGRGQAVMAVAALALLALVIPLVSLFSSAALALVALRKGSLESAWVLGLSALAAGVLGTVLTGSVYSAMVYGLLLWVPIWLAAVLLRESGQLALALEGALGLGLLAVLAVYVLVQDPSQMWQESLQRFLQPMLEHAPPGFDPAQLTQNVEFFSHYMSGIAAGGSVMSLILSLLIARWWQAMLFNPGGFRAEFHGLRLHSAVVYLGLGSFAAALTGGGAAEIAWNMNILFFVLFLVAGFAILHAVFPSNGARRFWLTGLYIATFIIPQLLLPVAFLGLTDVWFNWRRRIRHG